MPHIWDTPRQVWEDIYLLPDKSDYDGQALHLTVDALGDPEDPSHGTDQEEFHAEALKKLGSEEFWADDSDMIVRARDFSKAELLEWVKLWLGDQGLRASSFIEAPLSEFEGRTSHASVVAEVRRISRE